MKKVCSFLFSGLWLSWALLKRLKEYKNTNYAGVAPYYGDTRVSRASDNTWKQLCIHLEVNLVLKAYAYTRPNTCLY